MTVPPEPHLSNGDLHRLRMYHREFFRPFGLYLVTVITTAVFVGDDPAMPRRLLLLLPVVPALWAMRAVVRSLRRADEFERVVQLEAMSVGFGVALVASMTVGFLSAHADPNRFNQIGPWIIFSVAVLAWAATAQVRSGSRS